MAAIQETIPIYIFELRIFGVEKILKDKENNALVTDKGSAYMYWFAYGN
jgi:hypothetical protein